MTQLKCTVLASYSANMVFHKVIYPETRADIKRNQKESEKELMNIANFLHEIVSV